MMSLEDSGSKWFITDTHKLLVKRIRVWNFERISGIACLVFVKVVVLVFVTRRIGYKDLFLL